MAIKRLLLFAAALSFPLTAQAQQLSDTLPLDPNVTVGRLANGLTYYIRVNHKPEKRAELRLAVNVGSVLEDENQRGLAHVVEHMAFNGTEHFKKQQLVNYLESIGMRFGADVNAFTSFDETVYMLTVPTDTGRALEQGVQILEDWAHGQTFDPGEIAKERGVVIEEWRLGQGADERMRDKYFPVLFANSRYADRLPIGTKPSLDNFKNADLVRFYRTWYRPELMSVIAVGDFDKDKVEQLIKQHFSTLKATSQPRPLYPVPDHDSTRIAIVTDKEATTASVSVYNMLPVERERTVADYRRSLTQRLFTQMLNARPLVWLGQISYSLYLVQDLIKYATTESLAAVGLHHRQLSIPDSLALGAAMIVACLAVSTLTYRLVEEPARRLMKHGRRPRRTLAMP